MRKSLLLLLSLLFCIGSYATEKEVDVQEPGKLKKLIDKKEYLDITSLTIKGEINDKDMKVIECLTNLVSLDMSDVKGRFYYFPTLSKLQKLILSENCGNNYRDVKGEHVYISDGIKTCTSLRTVCARGEIANKIAGLPNLKTIAIIFDGYGRYPDGGLCVPIDTMILAYSWVDGHHSVGTTYCNFKPRYIINSKGETTLNAYEPNRTDYKGINILPSLPENAQINTPENLDLSDVHVIPSGYFKNGTMRTIKFSEQLRCIHSRAFENCKNITSIVFPGEKTTLEIDGYNVFGDCTNLKEIHFCGPVILEDMNEGNRMTLTFDKPSSIRIENPSSPFNHFVFNAVPTQLKLGGKYGTKVGDVLLYIEVPANTVSSFTKFVDEEYILEKGRKTKSYTLNLEKPGTILSNLPLNELDIIDSLTIVGFLYDTDMKIFEKCKRLTYLDLGRAFITYSPETLRKERQKMEALEAIFAMAGALADEKYDNFEMNALDHAYVKAFEQLAKGASTVSAADNNCIVPNESFANLFLLKKVILPYRAKHIGKDVLSNCINLESVELPLYIEAIRGSFNNCEKLRDIKFPSTLNYIAGFRGCNSIEVVDLSRCNFNSGYNTSASWSGAFSRCASLKEIHLPQGVKSGNDTDYGYIDRELRKHTLKVYIPATWEKFGSLDCWGNAELYFESPTAPGHFGHARNGCNVVIYCPKGSTTSYYNAVGGQIDNVKIIEQ